jgi:hypothetical protein
MTLKRLLQSTSKGLWLWRIFILIVLFIANLPGVIMALVNCGIVLCFWLMTDCFIEYYKSR